MSTRRELLKQAAATTLALTTSAPFAYGIDRLGTRAQLTRKASKSAGKSVSLIKSMSRQEGTVLRYGGSGDNWHMSWASDNRQYVSLCDGAGFSDLPTEWHNSRMLAISGGPRDAKFHDVPGYPKLSHPTQKKDDTRYYNFGTLALDGYLYQFMSSFNRPFRVDEITKQDELLRFNAVKLIYSPNNGRTWHNQNGSTPVVWESWDRRSRDTMVFSQEDQEAFSLLTVLQMGKNYEHNKDGYVYVYAPNGNTDGTMNELVMFRVPKEKVLDRRSYEYFAGRERWTKDIEARAVVHTFPRGWVNTQEHPYAWHPSVAYNAPLGMYMMTNWGMGCSPDGVQFGKPSYLGVWVASKPWGAWTQVHEETEWLPAGDRNARAYQPQIAPKWIADDGRSFWLVWTDFQITDAEARKGQTEAYKRNFNNNTYSGAEVIDRALSIRKYRRYYSFNAQRVDIIA